MIKTMKKKLLAGLISVFLIGATCNFTNAATINFSGLAEDGSGAKYLGNTVTQDGFLFTSTVTTSDALVVWQNSSPNHPTGGIDSTSLLEYNAWATTTMKKINGNTFNLHAIDLAPWGAAQTGTMNVTFTGITSGDLQIQQTFTVNNSNGSTPVLQSFEFVGFTDLVKVNFTQGRYAGNSAYQFNNIVVSGAPVPLPATMLLLGSGIFALAGSRIRRKKK